jgi:hypothetical protein
MHPGVVPSYDFRFVSMADLANAHHEEVQSLA